MAFMDRLKALAEAAQKLSPAALTPDKRYAHCALKAMALVVAADGKVEDDEVSTGFAVIENDGRILKYIGKTEAMGIFETYLGQALDGPAALRPVKTQRLIGEIGAHCPTEYKLELGSLCDAMAAVDGNVDPKEQLIVDQIKKALKVS